MKEDLSRSLIHNIERAVMDVWEDFTSRYSFTEYSGNIHYYNGWKTNKAFACNKKIILPLHAFDNSSGSFNPTCSVSGKLADIEKVMNYLDCGRTEAADMWQELNFAVARGISRSTATRREPAIWCSRARSF